MYYTVKLQIMTNQEVEKEFNTYAAIYLETLYRLVQVMDKQITHYSYSQYVYNDSVPASSKWLIYQYACKISNTHKLHHECHYHRKGSWASTDFKIIADYLYLNYGKAFYRQKGMYQLYIGEKQQYLLSQGKKVRLDLIYENCSWYCNIIMLIKEG